MSPWSDRLNQLAGRNRYVTCRLFVHLAGEEVAPLLGVLNRAAREAVAAAGEMETLGEGLVDVCQGLLDCQLYWQSAGNEGDVFWREEEAGDYISELFTDSAQRYGTSLEVGTEVGENEPLSLPATRNLVVTIVIAFVGESPALETNLAERDALEQGLKTLIDLHYQNRLQALQIHFAPAQLGDELTDEQVLLNYPELIPL